ncbi:MAG: DUF7948 domain-containing protein [Burkholderiales bacterium]
MHRAIRRGVPPCRPCLSRQRGQLEYDFVVSPEGDPSVISLAFDGASALEIDDAGALVLHTTAGASAKKPVTTGPHQFLRPPTSR